MVYQDTDQINGTAAHKTVDTNIYSTDHSILQGIDVYSERYNLIGKIDTYYSKTGILRERKKKIKQIYDGYIYQVYAQYFALKEMGYDVKKIELYSIDDNKKYPVALPEEDNEMLMKFESLIKEIREFSIDGFVQENSLKCKKCIYAPSCDRTMSD